MNALQRLHASRQTVRPMQSVKIAEDVYGIGIADGTLHGALHVTFRLAGRMMPPKRFAVRDFDSLEDAIAEAIRFRDHWRSIPEPPPPPKPKPREPHVYADCVHAARKDVDLAMSAYSVHLKAKPMGMSHGGEV